MDCINTKLPASRLFWKEDPSTREYLETKTFLMDRVDGQFYAVYEDGYNKMTTVPVVEWSADGRAQ